MYYFVPLVIFHRPVALLSHPCRLPVAFLSPSCRKKIPCRSAVALLSLSCRSPVAFSCRFPVTSLSASPVALLSSTCRFPVAYPVAMSCFLSLPCRLPVATLSPPCRPPVALLSHLSCCLPVACLSLPVASLPLSYRWPVVFLSPPCRLPVATLSPSCRCLPHFTVACLAWPESIEDMLQKQHRRRIFTVIDLKHGYHQMPLAEESRACTAMSTPLGPLQWKMMPMGVTNGNAAFQRMLENLLEPVRDCADPFVDDVIIASGNPSMSYEELLEAHERDVTRVLDPLVRHKLTGSGDKATIAVSEVVFAGHVVGNGQRKPIPGKVAAIEHWEKPKTVSELRAYLGFCNYYSGHIKVYAEYAAPMTTMLKGNREETKKGSKKALVWDADSDRAFEGMKQALLSAVGLQLVDPDRGFVLRTDASDYAVGAVLEQVLDDGRHVPVAFWSRVLAEGQRRTWTP